MTSPTTSADAVKVLDGYFLHNHAADLDEVRNAYLVLKEATQHAEAGAVHVNGVEQEGDAVIVYAHSKTVRLKRGDTLFLHPAQPASQQGEDTICMDALQALVDRDGGIVLHNGDHGGGKYGGLGLANTGRTLRDAAKSVAAALDQEKNDGR